VKLSEFITETLTEILAGVGQAAKNHKTALFGGFICPLAASDERDTSRLPLRDVEFDVAVTVESARSGSKSGGTNIRVIEASLSTDSSEKTVGESRVKFSVPVSMPSTRIEDA